MDKVGAEKVNQDIDRAFAYADQQQPRGVPERETHTAAAVFDPAEAADLEAQVFDRRDVLKHIREFARGRGVSPWSTLAVFLAWAVCMVPPNVVLPLPSWRPTARDS